MQTNKRTYPYRHACTLADWWTKYAAWLRWATQRQEFGLQTQVPRTCSPNQLLHQKSMLTREREQRGKMQSRNAESHRTKGNQQEQLSGRLVLLCAALMPPRLWPDHILVLSLSLFPCSLKRTKRRHKERE